jgi:hypothetical protein
MYFEDILKVAIRYWNIPPNINKIGFFYFEYVDDAWKELDDEYKYWVECLNWSIGVILSTIVENNDSSSVQTINLSSINVILLEQRFNEVDLQGDTWIHERKEYMGFRNAPDSNQMITEDYLNSI